MRTLVCSLCALFALARIGLGAVVLYYGSDQGGEVLASQPAKVISQGCLAVVELGQTQSASVCLFTLTAPSSKAGKAFDFKRGALTTFRAYTIEDPRKTRVTLLMSTSQSNTGGSTRETALTLSGVEVTVPVSTTANSAQSIPGSLIGQGAMVDPGSGNVHRFSLGLLLPQTQYENANGHAVATAADDAESYFTSIGGNKLD